MKVVHKKESFHTDAETDWKKKYLLEIVQNLSRSTVVLQLQHQNMSGEWPRFHNTIYYLYVV